MFSFLKRLLTGCVTIMKRAEFNLGAGIVFSLFDVMCFALVVSVLFLILSLIFNAWKEK